MNYKYPPIYKYGLLLLTIYMFIKHQKIMTSDKILLNAVLITLIIFIFDNIIIQDHPSLLEDVNLKKNQNNSEETEDFESELSDDEIDEIINSYNTDIDSRSEKNKQININIKRQQPQMDYYDTNMILH